MIAAEADRLLKLLMIAHMEPFRDRHKGATPGSA